MGLIESVKQNVLESYPIMAERDNLPVVQFAFTILLLPNKKPLKITGLSKDLEYTFEHIKSDKQLSNEIVEVLKDNIPDSFN